MNKYVPFLKLKVNEVGALNELADDLKATIVPFFDLPRKKEGMTAEEFCALTEKSARSVERNLSDFGAFYLDNFDIEDTVKVNGTDNYQFVIDRFCKTNFIPVIGLDRTFARNQLVFDAKKSGQINANQIALRLQAEDIEEFALVQSEILDLFNLGSGLFEQWILIIDNRVCIEIDAGKRAAQLLSFVPACLKAIPFDEVVVTGSSIPASIGDVIGTNSEGVHERQELSIFQPVIEKIRNGKISFGDYTIVSPLYSDIDIPPEALRNVTAPKIAYSYGKVHYIFRGGQLSSHPRGNLQYNDLAERLVSMEFYRTPPYSFGDHYLNEKANGRGKGVTPSSILKPTINAHITYMCRDFKF
ncbi:beta family protein [Undibacterium sp. SXout7W]|uniref:beta family protein n=1 Tax=Undibacterium sp. SXout7W TaxID=3413049 RepID=UPI003BF18680